MPEKSNFEKAVEAFKEAETKAEGNEEQQAFYLGMRCLCEMLNEIATDIYSIAEKQKKQ